MGVILKDVNHGDNILAFNWYTWRPIIEIIRASGAIIDGVKLELIGYNVSAEISKGECRIIVEYIETSILGRLSAGDRLMIDGTITSIPDDGTLYRDPLDSYKNYSVSKESLIKFIDFCNQCDGIKVG